MAFVYILCFDRLDLCWVNQGRTERRRIRSTSVDWSSDLLLDVTSLPAIQALNMSKARDSDCLCISGNSN